MRVYKLTDENGRTYGNTRWGEGVTHETSGEGELCGPGWLHAYSDPYLAVLLNPIHAAFSKPKLWVAEAEGSFKYDGELKLGATKLTTLREMPLPAVSVEMRVTFAIKCALRVYKAPAFVEWAHKWLSGEDRSSNAANAALRRQRAACAAYAANAADAAAYAAANAARAAAADAADAACAAARAAAHAAADAKPFIVAVAREACCGEMGWTFLA